jgi:hypothetical protein
LESLKSYKQAFKYIQKTVFPTIKTNADDEKSKTGKKTGPRQSHFRHWWKYWRDRPELIEKLKQVPRYIVCSRVTKRPIFEFINSTIRPNDALQVFPLADDYSFGILQSNFHWEWFINRCSTLKKDFRYTSDTVFDTFPFPQSPTLEQVQQVAQSAVNLRQTRREIMTKNQWSLRELYRNLTNDPQNSDIQKAQQAQEKLDQAVAIAYGMDLKAEPLEFLLNLNLEVTDKEAKGEKVTAPGLPNFVTDLKDFISQDCVGI